MAIIRNPDSTHFKCLNGATELVVVVIYLVTLYAHGHISDKLPSTDLQSLQTSHTGSYGCEGWMIAGLFKPWVLCVSAVCKRCHWLGADHYDSFTNTTWSHHTGHHRSLMHNFVLQASHCTTLTATIFNHNSVFPHRFWTNAKGNGQSFCSWWQMSTANIAMA